MKNTNSLSTWQTPMARTPHALQRTIGRTFTPAKGLIVHPPPLVMRKVRMSVWPRVDSCHQLPSLVHREGTATCVKSSGPSESRRRTNNKRRSARGQHNNRRASMFRRSNREIELINKQGNWTCKVQVGRMNVTSHDSVLRILKNRANRFKCKGKLQGEDNRLLAWALDETGIINTLQILSVEEIHEKHALIEQQEKNRTKELGLPEEVLRVHGVAPASKGEEGIICLIYKNMNGISNRVSNNVELEKANEIHDELEVDIAAYNEHWLNLRHRLNMNGFYQMFKDGEVAIQSITAHKTHKNIGHVQEEGTSLLMFGPITEHLDLEQSGKDPLGLGRWLVMTVKRDNGA